MGTISCAGKRIVLGCPRKDNKHVLHPVDCTSGDAVADVGKIGDTAIPDEGGTAAILFVRC